MFWWLVFLLALASLALILGTWLADYLDCWEC